MLERVGGESATSFIGARVGRYVHGNLQGPYLDMMVGSTSLRFSYLVLADERIKNMIKLGKIQNTASTSDVPKKLYVAYGKKR